MVARCIAEAERRNVVAVSAEIVATHEYRAKHGDELAERIAPLARETVLQRGRALAAERRNGESAALRRYIAAGGTRAGFQRAWRSLHVGQPASGYH